VRNLFQMKFWSVKFMPFKERIKNHLKRRSYVRSKFGTKIWFLEFLKETGFAYAKAWSRREHSSLPRTLMYVRQVAYATVIVQVCEGVSRIREALVLAQKRDFECFTNPLAFQTSTTTF